MAESSIILVATERKGWRASEGKEISRMARRRYQRGCLFKRGTNWILRYREDVLDADGNPLRVHRSVMLGQFSGKKKAWQEAERRLRSLNHGAHQPQSTITLHDFWTC